MAPPKTAVKVKYAAKPRTRKYPWEEVEAFFIQGEEVKTPTGVIVRSQPSMSDISRNYKIPVSTVSQRANTNDSNGKNWYQKRESFFAVYKTERDTRLAVEIADQEVAFRNSTLIGAQIIVQHALIQLQRGLRQDAEGRIRSLLDPDALMKLTAAVRKGQEIGLVAMDRGADGAQDLGGMDDWTLMRKVRAGLPGMPTSS